MEVDFDYLIDYKGKFKIFGYLPIWFYESRYPDMKLKDWPNKDDRAYYKDEVVNLYTMTKN